MPPQDVDKLLVNLARTPNDKLFAFGYDTSASLGLIAENWAVDMSSFPTLHHGRDFRPAGDWDMRTLATLATLSEFTQGQGEHMGVLVCYAVELRVGHGRVDKDLVVRVADVKRVIKDLLHPLRDAEHDEKPQIVRKRKAEYDEEKKMEKMEEGGE